MASVSSIEGSSSCCSEGLILTRVNGFGIGVCTMGSPYPPPLLPWLLALNIGPNLEQDSSDILGSFSEETASCYFPTKPRCEACLSNPTKLSALSYSITSNVELYFPETVPALAPRDLNLLAVMNFVHVRPQVRFHPSNCLILNFSFTGQQPRLARHHLRL